MRMDVPNQHQPSLRVSQRTTQSTYKSPQKNAANNNNGGGGISSVSHNKENANANMNDGSYHHAPRSLTEHAKHLPSSPSRGKREEKLAHPKQSFGSSSEESGEEETTTHVEKTNNDELKKEDERGNHHAMQGGEQRKHPNPIIAASGMHKLDEAFEAMLKKKVPISQNPREFNPDVVLKIDEDFSKKAMSLGYELGTIKHSAYALLAMAGPEGMTVANIVSIAKRLDLYNWGTCKTPNNSVTAALSQDGHFQRVAPSTYALKEHVPYDFLCGGGGGNVHHKSSNGEHHPSKKQKVSNNQPSSMTSPSKGRDDKLTTMNYGGGASSSRPNQKIAEASKRKRQQSNDDDDDTAREFFNGPDFLFQARSESYDSEEDNEDGYNGKNYRNYHAQRIQHEEEPFAYKDVAERLALECYRRRVDIQPELFRAQTAAVAVNNTVSLMDSSDAPETIRVLNEKNPQAIDDPVNCTSTVAASCLSYFPSVSTPGIEATRQRDAICATPPEPTEAFSRANLWKTEVGMVKRLEGFEALGRDAALAMTNQGGKNRRDRKEKKKSKLGAGEKKQKAKEKNHSKKSNSEKRSASASGEETCHHSLPRWVLDEFSEERHNIFVSQ